MEEKDSWNTAKNQIKSNIKWFSTEFDSIKNWLLELNTGKILNFFVDQLDRSGVYLNHAGRLLCIYYFCEQA